MSNESPPTTNQRGQTYLYWREIFAFAWKDTELLSRNKVLTTLGISLLAFVLQWAIGVRALYVTLQIIVTIIVAYVCVALVGFLGELLLAPAARDEKVQRENKELTERLRPKMEITYMQGRDDHVVTGSKGAIRSRVVRLRLTNIGSGNPVEGIKVKAECFLNFGDIPLYGTPLHVSHDHDNEKLKGFSINPGDKERIDIVSKATDSPDIFLCHALGVKFLAVTHTKEFTIKVVVTAVAATPQEATLQISVDRNGDLSCKLETAYAASSQKVGSMPSS